ncbi:MAG: ribonuclease P protein component [Clostridiales bacterium]|nr:ribonuclease P protein component [Clostridiales bacterium]
MKNTNSLKLNKDFRRLYRRGKSFAGGYVVVYAAKNKTAQNRLGLTVSKSVGKAVMRNRTKRLIRESYAHLEDGLVQGMDFIIVARNRAAGKAQQQIENDLRFVMDKLELLKQ